VSVMSYIPNFFFASTLTFIAADLMSKLHCERMLFTFYFNNFSVYLS
jgi:hypothetical protein